VRAGAEPGLDLQAADAPDVDGSTTEQTDGKEA
jgi:hypothetical protein